MHHFIQAAYGVSGPSSARDHKLKLMLKILLEAGADPLIRDNSPNSDGYTAMDYAAINGNAALFFHLLSIALQNSQNPRASEQLLSSAWSLSVAGEQWQLLKQLMAHDSEFDPDLSLLMWPTGAHLLKYAIAVYDRELLEAFSTTSSETPNRSPRRANRLLLEEAPNNRDEDAAQLRLTCWEGLPSVLRANDRGWSSDQIRFWEDSVKSHGLHRGGDPLNEIFGFLATLDRSTLVAYFGNTDRGRFPVNENAFRWEDCVNYITTPSHAIGVLHGDEDNDWTYAAVFQVPNDKREEAKNPDRQTESGRDDEENPFLSSSSSSSSERDTAIS